MRLAFAPRAVHDLEAAAKAIRSEDAKATEPLRSVILDAIDHVLDFPDSGRGQHLTGVRKLAVRKYPYVIYYLLDAEADQLVVLAIQRAAPSPPRKTSRPPATPQR